MFTMIVYPKGGSRDEVTAVHRFLFYCLFNAIEVNLPDLMCRLIEQCFKHPNRVLPYAAPLSAVFARFASPSLAGVKGQYIMQSGVYNQSFIMKFMGYHIQDNEIFRDRPGDSSSEEENEEEEEEEEEAPPAADAPHDVDDQDVEPSHEPMDTSTADRERTAASSSAFKSRMEERMDRFESHLQTIQSNLDHLTLDVAQFNLNFERMRVQLDNQHKFIEDI